MDQNLLQCLNSTLSDSISGTPYKREQDVSNITYLFTIVHVTLELKSKI